MKQSKNREIKETELKEILSSGKIYFTPTLITSDQMGLLIESNIANSCKQMANLTISNKVGNKENGTFEKDYLLNENTNLYELNKRGHGYQRIHGH
jgi:hypothetical protein